jgi:hypothetical protein
VPSHLRNCKREGRSFEDLRRRKSRPRNKGICAFGNSAEKRFAKRLNAVPSARLRIPLDQGALNRPFGAPAEAYLPASGARSVDALLRLLHRRCQTISYYGIPVDDLVSLLCQSGPRGGHRVVAMGNTVEFSLTWNGYDTIRTLSRKLELIAEAPGAGWFMGIYRERCAIRVIRRSLPLLSHPARISALTHANTRPTCAPSSGSRSCLCAGWPCLGGGAPSAR